MSEMNWNKYPYTDFHELNLDFILNKITDLEKEIEDFTEYNEIKFHDPIEWNISTQYTRNTVVSSQGIAYLSKQPVPSGIAINNTEFWLPIGNFDTSTNTIREGITIYNEGVAVRATRNYSVGNLVWWKNNINIVIAEIVETDVLGPANLSRTSISDELIKIRQSIATVSDDLDNEIVDRQTAITQEAIERDAAIAAIKIDDLNDVDASNPLNGQILKYNANTGRWYTANESGGGGGGSVDIDNVTITYNLNNQIQVANDLQTKLGYVDTEGSISDALDEKADVDALDEWEPNPQTVSVEGENTLTFTGVDPDGAYDLYFETPDGSQVTLKSSSLVGTTLSYVIDVPVVPTVFKLRYIK